MDFKIRNPNLIRAKIHQASELQTCPFDCDRTWAGEFLSPDGQTRFLGLSGGMNDNEQMTERYLVEAPVDCVMRIAFETGRITWRDYWLDRPWLIHWQYGIFDESLYSVKYVTPRELSTMGRCIITKFDDRCPLELKCDYLEGRIHNDISFGRDSRANELAYRNFLKVYEQRMGKQAA